VDRQAGKKTHHFHAVLDSNTCCKQGAGGAEGTVCVV
jgi:hypothetical protein